MAYCNLCEYESRNALLAAAASGSATLCGCSGAISVCSGENGCNTCGGWGCNTYVYRGCNCGCCR